MKITGYLERKVVCETSVMSISCWPIENNGDETRVVNALHFRLFTHHRSSCNLKLTVFRIK